MSILKSQETGQVSRMFHFNCFIIIIIVVVVVIIVIIIIVFSFLYYSRERINITVKYTLPNIY